MVLGFNFLWEQKCVYHKPVIREAISISLSLISLILTPRSNWKYQLEITSLISWEMNAISLALYWMHRVRAVSSVHPVPLNSVNISQKIKINRPHTKTVSPHAWRKWIGWHPTVQIFFFLRALLSLIFDGNTFEYLALVQPQSCKCSYVYIRNFLVLARLLFHELLPLKQSPRITRDCRILFISRFFLIISAQFKNEVAMINSQLFS